MSINDSFFINRRNFLKSSAAGLALLPGADFGSLLQEKPAAKAKVVLIKTSDRKQGVSQALKMMDLASVANKNVLIKPNFNTADATPGSTHNDTLSQLVYEMRERGARDVTLGESSGPPVTRGVMESKGIFDLAGDMKFNVIN